MVDLIGMSKRIEPLKNLIDRYSLARETLEWCRPGHAIEAFGPFEDLRTMLPAELDEFVEQGRPIVERAEALAAEAKAEKDHADQRSMTEIDRLWRTIDALTRRVAQLEAVGAGVGTARQQSGQGEKPQMLMPPRGPVVVAPIGASAPGTGVRALGRAAADSGSEASALVPAQSNRRAGPGVFHNS